MKSRGPGEREASALLRESSARAKQRSVAEPHRKAFIMNAQQAKDYGIVDDIIFKHK
jgi:ATP-dependent protease ClpP protease subunit